MTNRTAEMPIITTAGSVRRGGRGWVMLAVLLIVVAAGFVVVRNGLPSLLNPFESQTSVTSSPVLVQSIRDMHKYVAAEGQFQVIVDVQQGRDNIPDVLFGERTVVVGVGNVAAYVDFAGFDDGDLTVSPDGTSIALTLPAPALDPPALDTQRSYVASHDEGIANRIAGALGNDPTDQLTIYHQAEVEIAKAAAQSDLTERARTNTTAMMTSLMRQLGFETVEVSYADPVRS